jgi:ubiquinone biosynthesis protein COQ9
MASAAGKREQRIMLPEGHTVPAERYDARTFGPRHMDTSAEFPPDTLRQTDRLSIVQAALRLGEEAGSWDAVHVHAVARAAGISFEELRRHFPDKDGIAEGYFDIADAALLSVSNEPGWDQLEIRERLYRAMMAWLDALSPHRRLAVGMLAYKLQPEHLHLQARGIARISRTVQWIREVAMLPSIGWRRELEEAVLTTIYLTTFSSWLTDKSAGAERTRRLLSRLLARAEKGALWLGIASQASSTGQPVR